MATVQEIAELEQVYKDRMAVYQEQVTQIIRAANASGKPQWTEDLRNQRDAINAAMEPFVARWNTLLRLREARELVLHLKFDRLELDDELGVNVTLIVGDRNWPHHGALDTANAATLAKYGMPSTFAECKAEGDVHSPVARYLEARDLDTQAELDSLKAAN